VVWAVARSPHQVTVFKTVIPRRTYYLHWGTVGAVFGFEILRRGLAPDFPETLRGTAGIDCIADALLG
jgi:hypothetical protein